MEANTKVRFFDIKNWKKMKYGLNALVFLSIVCIFQGCHATGKDEIVPVNNNGDTTVIGSNGNSGNDDPINVTSTLNIDVTQKLGAISPLIMGFNIVYDISPDNIWLNGSGAVPQSLKKLKAGIFRYPAGTIVTFYHWNHLNGRGHVDSWEPGYNASNDKSPSSYMDIDEYLEVCAKLNTEPLVGINMASGMKYNRMQDGLDEAKALMQHCIQKGFHVKYYYLDNEPYLGDANYTYTATEYAETINRYVTVMKQVDNDIKIIANTMPVYSMSKNYANYRYTDTLVWKAGKNIDFLDVHNYWSHSGATYAKWQSEDNMHIGGIPLTYRDQRAYFQQIAIDRGYPNIDMITLEWNIGTDVNNPPTQAQAALMVGEQFMQIIQSGMKMATFWPLYWPGNISWSQRPLLDANDDYAPNKKYGMFALYTSVLGQEKVKSTSSLTRIQSLSVQSNNNDTLWVYIVNKDNEHAKAGIDIHIEGFEANSYEAIGFLASDNSSGPLDIANFQMESINKKQFKVALPMYSFAKITFVR